jgi:Tfp pilus assembly protein PilN
MSVHEVNLVPPSIAARVRRGKASRRVAGLSSVAGACMLLVAGASRMIDTRSTAQLAIAREHAAPVIALEEEIARLREDRASLAERIELQRAIGVAVPATPLIRAIAATLPSGSLLEHIDLEYANVQGTNKKIRRSARDAAVPRELRGEISGIAANEADVGRIIDGLTALAPMSQVSLESSRSREFRGRNAREFRIQFRVDLDLRWKLPEVLAASDDAVDGREGDSR